MTATALSHVPPAAKELARRYLLPCSGYTSSIEKNMAPPDALTGDSRDCVVSAQEGQVMRRRGHIFYNETDPTNPTGLLESVSKNMGANMMGRQMLDLQYPSAVPGQIIGPTEIFTDQTGQMHAGQSYVLTSVQGTRKVFGHEMGTLAAPGTTHYPRTAASTEPRFKVVPMPCLAGGVAAEQGNATQAILYNRCACPLHRMLLDGGSFKAIQAGRYTLTPNLHGTPRKSEGYSNPSTTTGTERVRSGPWGHMPPLFTSTLDTLPSASTTSQLWWDGDTWYEGWIFQNEDGSFSMPFIPRAVNSNLTTGLGLITVNGNTGKTTTTPSAYPYVDHKNIPIGHPGTRARIGVRTYKVNLNAVANRVTYPAMPAAGSLSTLDAGGQKLYVFAVIQNNTQTTYRDAGASDTDSLRDDSLTIRLDHLWPLPSRYAFPIERRIGLGYSRRQNPCAIILAPTGINASRDLNVADDSAAGYSATAQAWRLYQDTAGAQTLKLRKVPIGGGNGTVSDQSIAIGATDKITDVVDKINATTFASNGGEWAAQLAPGTDGNIPATNLAASVLDVASCVLVTTGNSVTAGAGAFADVAIGMRVKVQSGTGTLAGTYLVIGKSKTTANDDTIALGTENGVALNPAGAGMATLRFWCDTGDDSWSADTTTPYDVGNIRSYLATFPAVIALKGSYLTTFTLDKQGILYTSASPGSASLAPQSFFNAQGNRKSVLTTAGIFMGGVSLDTDAILYYSEHTYLLKNVKGANTGEDQDYHPFLIDGALGCIQYGTVTNGHNWAGGLTREGYEVTDGQKSVIITNPSLLNPAHGGSGILVDQCMANTQFQGVADQPQYQVAHAAVADGLLYLSFQRRTALSGIDAANLLATAVAAKYASTFAFAGYGFDIKSGYNDRFYYTVASIAYTAVLTAGSGYTGGTLATMLATAMNAGGHGLVFTVAYSGTTGLFTISTSSNFTIDRLTYATPAFPAFGFKAGVSPAAATTFTSDWVRTASTFWLQVTGLDTNFLLGDALTTICAQLGWDATNDPGSEAGQNTTADHQVFAPFYFNSGNNQLRIDQSGTFSVCTITQPTADQFVCTYDFSAGIEASGLAQVVGPNGPYPWSAPQKLRVGAMARTWDGKVYGANDDNAGSSANGSIYQLDTGSFDQPVKATAVSDGGSTIKGSLNQATGAIAATVPGDLRRVAVGAKVQGAGITGTATVIGKSVDTNGDGDGVSVTISGTLTGGTSNVPYTFWGAEIEAIAYQTCDHMDEPALDKSVGAYKAIWACPTGETMRLQHCRDVARLTARTVRLKPTGAADATTHRAPMLDQRREFPSAARTKARVAEFAVLWRNGSMGSDPIARGEFFGGIAPYELMEGFR
jgi:hypothetical protein